MHPLECLTCKKCFFRRANLALHMKTHLGIKNYKCDICEKRFITRQKVTEHRNMHTGRAPVKCTLCDDTFRRYSNMVQHRDRHHFKKKTKIRDFVCHCGAVFHSRAKLLWHKETHEDKPKACLYCSDKFVHAASLTRHVRRSHNEHFADAQKGRENVPCPVCKQLYLRANLRAHLLTHSGKRPYNCIRCNKGFTTRCTSNCTGGPTSVVQRSPIYAPYAFSYVPTNNNFYGTIYGLAPLCTYICSDK